MRRLAAPGLQLSSGSDYRVLKLASRRDTKYGDVVVTYVLASTHQCGVLVVRQGEYGIGIQTTFSRDPAQTSPFRDGWSNSDFADPALSRYRRLRVLACWPGSELGSARSEPQAAHQRQPAMPKPALSPHRSCPDLVAVQARDRIRSK